MASGTDGGEMDIDMQSNSNLDWEMDLDVDDYETLVPEERRNRLATPDYSGWDPMDVLDASDALSLASVYTGDSQLHITDCDTESVTSMVHDPAVATTVIAECVVIAVSAGTVPIPTYQLQSRLATWPDSALRSAEEMCAYERLIWQLFHRAQVTNGPRSTQGLEDVAELLTSVNDFGMFRPVLVGHWEVNEGCEDGECAEALMTCLHTMAGRHSGPVGAFDVHRDGVDGDWEDFGDDAWTAIRALEDEGLVTTTVVTADSCAGGWDYDYE